MMQKGVKFYLANLVVCLFLSTFSISLAVGADFNWRKYEGTTIRVIDSKSAFTKIDKKYIPYWRMPNFNFQTGFTELFRQLVNWEIPESVDFIKEKINPYFAAKILLNKYHYNQ